MAEVFSRAEARKSLAELVNRVRYGRKAAFIGARGKAEVAVIDIDTYNALAEAIEELNDIQASEREMEAHTRGEGRPAADVVAEMRHRRDR